MINYDLNYQLEASKRIKLHSKYFLSIFKILKLLRHDFLENRFFKKKQQKYPLEFM